MGNHKTQFTIALSVLLSSFLPVGASNLAKESPQEKNIAKRRDASFIFYADASYTYWVPYQDLLYVYYTYGGDNYSGTYIEPEFNGRSGFKVSAGVKTFDGWSLFANYTWFQQNPAFHTHTVIAGENYDSPYLFFTSNFNPIASKFATFFNRVDVSFDREYFNSSHFSMRPWMGLLAAFDSQYLSLDAELSLANFIAYGRYKQWWWGIGPYAGVKCSYKLIDSLELFIRPGAAVLSTDRRVDKFERRFNQDDDEYESPRLNNYYKLLNVEPMLELSLGVAIIPSMLKDHLVLKLAWETQTYFSHACYQPSANDKGLQGNYSLQGATATVGIQF